MTRLPDKEFSVSWLPFQLNANASKTPQSKVEMYMKKFGRTREQVMQMSASMKANFDRVGLPFNFTDKGVTGNTFNSHRLIAMAGTKGPEVQDKVVESLFNAYFNEEKFLNDPDVLVQAAMGGGIDEASAKSFVENEKEFAKETSEELQIGREMRVTGVPFFVITNEDTGKKAGLSGAQPPEQFVEVFHALSDTKGRMC